MSAADEVIAFANLDDFRRGQGIGHLLLAEISAFGPSKDAAKVHLESGLKIFEELGVQEGLNCELAARVFRGLSDCQRSHDSIAVGLEWAKEYPLVTAGLRGELAILLRAEGRIAESDQQLALAQEIFLKCGVERRWTNLLMSLNVPSQ